MFLHFANLIFLPYVSSAEAIQHNSVWKSSRGHSKLSDIRADTSAVLRKLYPPAFTAPSRVRMELLQQHAVESVRSEVTQRLLTDVATQERVVAVLTPHLCSIFDFDTYNSDSNTCEYKPVWPPWFGKKTRLW